MHDLDARERKLEGALEDDVPFPLPAVLSLDLDGRHSLGQDDGSAMIKYLGSKRALLPLIVDVIHRRAPHARTALDLFSGSARVGHALKGAGLRVIANDHNAFSSTIARGLVGADAALLPDVERHLAELNRLPGRAGWFTHTFCENARYFQAKNGARIEAIRADIARRALAPDLEAALLTSLLLAADKVDSTVGVQMAYLKQWAPRAHNDLMLRPPPLLPRSPHGHAVITTLDARDAARRFHVDVAYLDPPYNQHSYLGNYHVWETLVRFDAPDTYGVAHKRVDVKDRTSAFNHKRQALEALRCTIERVNAALLVVSFSNEGFFDADTLARELATRGSVEMIEVPHKRYVGARIGIYNPAGEKVGAVSHVTNRERLFVVHTGAGRA